MRTHLTRPIKARLAPLRRGFSCPRVYRRERNIGYKNSDHSTEPLYLLPEYLIGLALVAGPLLCARLIEVNAVPQRMR